jgi:hypothetical protein
MFITNFRQISNCETWFDQFGLVAEDDGTPLTSAEVTVSFQLWARSPRGAGDQSQRSSSWPNASGGWPGSAVLISANTDDGTGILALDAGVLTLNVPLSTMQMLIPGYYEVGITVRDKASLITQQLTVGTVPIYQGGV